VLNFYDRHVPGALTEPIRKEFHLTDTQIGLLGSAFIWIYALVGLPLGRIADMASRKKLLAAAIVVWSSLTASAAFAGLKNTGYTVTVIPSSMFASGGLADVRAAADTTQYIGCYSQAIAGSTGVMGCWARDARGVQASCYSVDAEIVKTAAALSSDTRVSFNWNAQGQCTGLIVEHGSYLAPKAP